MLSGLPDETGGGSDDDFTSDDGEEAQNMMTKLKFPIIEKEVNPASMVPKVSSAVQKRLMKLLDSKSKLEAIANRNEIQEQFRDKNRTAMNRFDWFKEMSFHFLKPRNKHRSTNKSQAVEEVGLDSGEA